MPMDTITSPHDRYAMLLAYDLHVIKCLSYEEIDQVIAKAKEEIERMIEDEKKSAQTINRKTAYRTYGRKRFYNRKS